jgi:hypothetical protein
MAITQADLDNDKAAVEAAQKKLADDQAAFDAIQPHLSVLAEIEALAFQFSGDTALQLSALVAKARALF